jgi:hypothetical protein
MMETAKPGKFRASLAAPSNAAIAYDRRPAAAGWRTASHDRAALLKDFRDGKISAGKIRQDYGIDINADAKTGTIGALPTPTVKIPIISHFAPPGGRGRKWSPT